MLNTALKEWQVSQPQLAAWAEKNLPEGFAVFELPEGHRVRMRTTNGLERLNKELKRRTQVATLFPNPDSCLRLVSALLAEQDEEWMTAKIYLNMTRLAQAPVLCSVRFDLPSGRGRKARSVQQNIRAEQVDIGDGAGGQLSVTCVLAEEANPPAGSKPVVWRLLSNRPVNTLEEAVELIDWYRARWEIELFFLILKEGYRIEALQLGRVERIETALALYLVVAWRINRLMRLGRSLPELPADLLFEQDEWQAAYILNKKPVPKKTPDLNSVVRLIARLGGFLCRKCDGEPGAKTLWLRLRDIAVFVEGARFARRQL